MKRPTKFVKPVTAEQREQLKAFMHSPAVQRKRMRAHAILLSERRYSIDQIADIYQVDRDRVSAWLDGWDESQLEGLDDAPRSGRPPKLTEQEQQQALKCTLQEPRSLRQGRDTPWGACPRPRRSAAKKRRPHLADTGRSPHPEGIGAQ